VKIFFALAALGGQYQAPFVTSMFHLLPALARNGIGTAMSTISFPDIEVARNYLVTTFFDLKPDCTHMLIVDADMGFPPQLIADMLDLDVPVCGVAYPRKGILPGGGLSFIHGALDRSEERNGFVRTDACGTGVMMIKREAIARMIETLPEIVDKTRFKTSAFADRFERFLTPFTKVRLEDRELSTDYSFCRR